MIYTMSAGVDRQMREKIASGILYGTGLVVAAFLAVAPFTGNNTVWNGGSNGQGKTSKSSSGRSASTKTLRSAAGSPTGTTSSGSASAASGGTASSQQSTTSKTLNGTTYSAPVTATNITSPAPVGRGGDSSGTSTTSSSPTPGLPLTQCTPTTSIDPLITVNPICVN